MKKYILLLLILLTITGCKDKEKTENFKCSFQNTYEESEFTTNVDVKVVNNIIKDATAIMTFKEATLAKTMCNVLKQAEDSSNDLICDNKKITIKNYHKSVSKKDVSKDDFLKYMEKQEFICETK